MKAAVITAPGKVEVTTVADPTPRPREVVVEVAACGICGTDLHILQGEFAPSLPSCRDTSSPVRWPRSALT